VRHQSSRSLSVPVITKESVQLSFLHSGLSALRCRSLFRIKVARSRTLLICVFTALVLSTLWTSSASAAVGPQLEVVAASNSSAAPGSTFNYYVNVLNVGDGPTDGSSLTFKGTLPSGLEAISAQAPEGSLQFGCPAEQFPTQAVTCELPAVLPTKYEPGGPLTSFSITVKVDSVVTNSLSSSFTVEGGGAAEATTVRPIRILAAPAEFGIDGFDQRVTDSSGAPATQASGHPGEVSTDISFNTFEAPNSRNGESWPVEPPRDALVELPAGFLGDPNASDKCTLAQLVPESLLSPSFCPAAAQVGVVRITSTMGEPLLRGQVPLYNMVAPAGVPARFSFSAFGTVVSLDASVRSGKGYGLTIASRGVSEGIAVSATRVTFWGIPADPSHDFDRLCPGVNAATYSATDPRCDENAEKVGIPPYVRPPLEAFLRNPTSCTPPGEGLTTTLHIDSWFNPGRVNPDGSPDLTDPAWKSASTTSHEAPGYPYPPSEWGPTVGIDHCEEVPFEPTISVRPTTDRADSPSGLTVDLQIPQRALVEPGATAQSDLKGAVVKLPEGMSVNPAQADGLGGCTLAEIDLHGENTEPSCPDSSKIGTMALKTPLLDHEIEGSVYLGAQKDNPFGSLLSLYIVGDDLQQSGTVVKLAGEVRLDPGTGRLETVFTDQPQLPFETLHLELFGGAHAALVTPARCGTYTTRSTLSPWSGNADVKLTDSFELTEGPAGSGCPPTPAAFAPALGAGTTTPVAGAFSPFGLRLSREDGSQRFAALDLTLPPGLTGKLAGIPYCPEAALAAVSEQEGTAAAQIASPSCPAASLLGHVTVGAGSGPDPFFVKTGKAYLAGPYKGAPLSLAIVTPALAGPFDLGSVVVRTALRIDPESARVTAASDPLPTILHGIPLDLRDIRVNLDRPRFMLNPTSCDPMSIDGTVDGTEGARANVSARFQVGDCAKLPFKPHLALKLKGGTRRGDNPALRATLTMPKGSANIARTQVALPHSEFLDQAHIRTICTRVQFAAEACPPGSVYGHARAFTPLLDRPLEGPVYLRSSDNPLPDLVADLDGQIHIVLDGRIDSKHGGIRTTFASVPDAPVSKFVLTMKGGRKGLLQNSTGLCGRPRRATVQMDAHSGKTGDSRPLLKSSCGKKARR